MADNFLETRFEWFEIKKKYLILFIALLLFNFCINLLINECNFKVFIIIFADDIEFYIIFNFLKFENFFLLVKIFIYYPCECFVIHFKNKMDIVSHYSCYLQQQFSYPSLSIFDIFHWQTGYEFLVVPDASKSKLLSLLLSYQYVIISRSQVTCW